MTPGPKQRWSDSFADPSGESFGAILSRDVELDGSALAGPVRGRHAVWTYLRTASGLHENVQFTHEVATGNHVYLEWNSLTFGMRMDGLTVLLLDDHGQFTKVTVHQRPLAAVLAYSAEMERRLSASSDPGQLPAV